MNNAFFTRNVLLSSVLSFVASFTQAESGLAPSERQAVVAAVVQEMNRYYVFPETAKNVEVALRQQQAAKSFDDVVDGPTLAKRLTESLQAVTRDKHIMVAYSERPVPVRQQADDTPTPQQLAEWLKEGQFQNFGV